MKTFKEYFIQYTRDLSFENLFFTKEFINKKDKVERKYLPLLLPFVVIGLLYSISTFNHIYTFIFIILLIIIYFIVIPKIFRTELRKNKMPVPNKWEFYKWKSEELNSLRILEIYKAYDKESDKVISKLIEIATELINKSIESPLLIFEKYTKKTFRMICIILPILIALCIPIFVDSLRFLLDNELLISKEEIRVFINKYFNELIDAKKLIFDIIVLFLVLFISIIYYYMYVRNILLSKISDDKEDLEEYVYILKNIRLLRLQKRAKKKKTLLLSKVIQKLF